MAETDYAPENTQSATDTMGGAPYSLPCPAEELYESLAKYRQQVIDTARLMASITIPSVYPPMGYRTGNNIDESNQSIGAMCVNTLASKLMFMALPPDRPVLRFEPIEHKLGNEIKQNPKLWTTIQIALNALEQEHRSRLETTNIRSAYIGAVKQNLVAGNFLWEHLKLDFPVYHTMDHYVVKRNNHGEQLLTILKRRVMLMDLDPEIRKQVNSIQPRTKGLNVKDYEEELDVYAVCKRIDDSGAHDGYAWEYWEEYEGQLLEGTEVTVDYDIPPLYAAWMIPVYGQNWGRSYCEEYRGDLFIADGHSKAINDGAAIASLILMFLKAGSRTSAKQIRKAGNMSLLTGQADDLTAFHLEKQADFQFVSNNLEAVVKRLGRSFLLVSSVQRQAERVTAEEWKELAQEIDQATGGLYSENAQTFQRHVIRRAVTLHNEEDKQLPKLPPGIFRVAVITGIEAMGRSIEGQNLMRATQGITQTYGPEALAKYTDPLEFIRRVYVSENVKQDGLVLDQDTVAQNMAAQEQKQQKALMLQHGTGPAINAMGKQAELLNKAVGAENANPSLPPPGGQPAVPPTTGQQ